MLRRGQANVGELRARAACSSSRAGPSSCRSPTPTFDALTFTYLLRYVADPAATLRELARVLKPGGADRQPRVLGAAHPFWRAWWWLYTRLVLPVAGSSRPARTGSGSGRFLGPNISAHYRRYPLAWTVAAWQDAGIVDVEFRR